MSDAETLPLEERGQEATELSDDVTLAAIDKTTGEVVLDIEADTDEQRTLTVTPASAEGAPSSVDGLFVWEGESDRPASVVQPITNGVRVMSVFDSAEGPDTSEVVFDAGEKIKPTFFDDGAVILHSAADDTNLGLIESPWAVDASGREVPTWYEWRAGTLVQHVALSDAYDYPVVADPTWTYAHDLWATGGAGYQSPGTDAYSAMRELRRCFNCSFPIGNAPALLTTTQVINLNASPFSFIEVRAPVKTTQISAVGFTFVAQAGHFDGAGSEIKFRFYSTCMSGVHFLRLSVNATVIKDRGSAANAANSQTAKFQWQRSVNQLDANTFARNGTQRC